ncbi:MAG: hypothetical protein WDN27_00825 [Candidatus Saccharibacteria bacterium]
MRPAALVIIAAAVIGVISLQGNADAAASGDIFRIQSSIISYYHTHNALPHDIKSLQVKGLKRGISSYTYTYADDPFGQNQWADVCAQFGHDTMNGAYSGSVSNSPDAYAFHRKGRQCYENSFIKGQAQISIIPD